MSEADRELGEKIGQVLATLESIPIQLTLIFDKLEREYRERLASESQITSDIRSLREGLERLQSDFSELRLVVAEADVQEMDSAISSLVATVNSLKELQDRLVIVMKLTDEGSSSVLEGLQKEVASLHSTVGAIISASKGAKALIIGLLQKVAALSFAILLAYLLWKLGLK